MDDTEQRTVADNKFLVWPLVPFFLLSLQQITFLEGNFWSKEEGREEDQGRINNNELVLHSELGP
jgi:hypothetical protein